MSNPADIAALSPFALGEAFFANVATIQRWIADSMLAAFDALADAMADSLRASAQLTDQVSRAESPAEAAAAGYAWMQGRVTQSLGWLRGLAERLMSGAFTPGGTALPALADHAPVPQDRVRMPTKPPAGKIRSTPSGIARPAKPILVAKTAKKAARPAAK